MKALDVFVVTQPSTWTRLSENFKDNAKRLAACLGYEKVNVWHYTGANGRTILKSKFYDKELFTKKVNEGRFKLMEKIVESNLEGPFVVTEDDILLDNDAPWVAPIPNDVNFINLITAYHTKNVHIPKTRPDSNYFGAPEKGVEIFQGAAAWFRDKESIKEFLAFAETKKNSDRYYYDQIISDYFHSNPKATVCVPSIGGQTLESYTANYSTANYSKAKINESKKGIKFKSISKPAELNEYKSFGSFPNPKPIKELEQLGFKIEEFKDKLIVSKLKREVTENEKEELLKGLDSFSVFSAKFLESPHNSMKASGEVPFFQPFLFAIRKATLNAAGSFDPYFIGKWGGDIEWSIRIRKTFVNDSFSSIGISDKVFINRVDIIEDVKKDIDLYKTLINDLDSLVPEWRNYKSTGKVSENWNAWTLKVDPIQKKSGCSTCKRR
jgi:hypothetical protein